MAYKIVWTEYATQDLQSLLEYIEQDSLNAAKDLAILINEKVISLEKMPYRGRVLPEFFYPPLRELIIGNYRLIYEIKGKRIIIHGIIHGSRDLLQMWENGERFLY